jgi:hypothetical protein
LQKVRQGKDLGILYGQGGVCLGEKKRKNTKTQTESKGTREKREAMSSAVPHQKLTLWSSASHPLSYRPKKRREREAATAC